MRRGQLKIQQMSFMLLAVVLFFILAGLFFLTIRMNSLKKDAELMERDKALLNAGFIAGSAEFSCGPSCIDTDRVMVLKNIQAYKNFWPFSIEIRRIYPDLGREIECAAGNYPNCNLYKVYKMPGNKQEKKIDDFVVLCRREQVEGYDYMKCELGKMILGYEVKT